MAESFEFDAVDRLTIAALGDPGSRLFLLQAKQGRSLATIKLEKQQVAALAVYLGRVLADLPQPENVIADLTLEEPVEPAWAAGPIGVSYDEDSDRVVLALEEFIAEDDDTEPATARIVATRDQVAAVAIHGTALVAAGRPPCPLCGYPLDPSGHVCPRTNGQRPPKL